MSSMSLVHPKVNFRPKTVLKVLFVIQQSSISSFQFDVVVSKFGVVSVLAAKFKDLCLKLINEEILLSAVVSLTFVVVCH